VSVNHSGSSLLGRLTKNLKSTEFDGFCANNISSLLSGSHFDVLHDVLHFKNVYTLSALSMVLRNYIR